MRLIEDMIELLESLGYEVTKKKSLEHQKAVYQNPYNTTNIKDTITPFNYDNMGTGIEYLNHMIDG